MSLPSGNSSTDRKPAYRALLLNAAGQEVDEQGNVIQQNTNVVVKTTLAANNALLLAGKEKEKPQKKENPYLQHWTTSSSSTSNSHYTAHNKVSENGSAAVISALPGTAVDGSIELGSRPTAGEVAPLRAEEETRDLIAEDARLRVVSRTVRARKGLQFIEAGALVRKAAELQEKEERKLIAGYASGRKNLEVKRTYIYM